MRTADFQAPRATPAETPSQERDAFHVLADVTPVLIWTSGPDKQETYFNQSWLTFTGKTSEELDGAGWLECVHPDDRDALWQTCSSSFCERRPFTAEFRLRRATGEYRWLLDTGVPRFDANGIFQGFIGSCVDITDRKRGDEARAELAAIVECSDDAIISKSLDGTIRTWNPGATRMFGYSAEEAIGRPVQILIPDDLREEEDSILQRLQQGEKIAHFETVRVARDGRRIDISLSVSPILNARGEIVGVAKTARDITERRRKDEALRKSEQRFARFMQHLPGLAWIKDGEGRYLFVNDSALEAFSRSREQVYGATDQDLFPPETAAQFRSNDERARCSEAGIQTIETLDDSNGVTHYSLVSKFPIQDEEGQSQLVGGIAIDVTEQKLTEGIVQEHRRILELIAQGESLPICLDEVCRGIERIDRRLRAGVLLADELRTRFEQVVIPRFWDLAEELQGMTLGGGETSACAELLIGGRMLACADLAADERWPNAVRRICLDHGIQAGCAAPIFESEGLPVGSLLLGFDTARPPRESDQRIAEMATSLIGILLRRDRAEEALRESERRYRQTIQAAPLAIYTTDLEGRITLFNQAAVDLWGRTPEPEDRWCGAWRVEASDGTPMPLDTRPIAITVREGRAVRHAELVIRRPDGSRVQVIPFPEPLYNSTGGVVGAVNMLVDISERKRSEDAVRQRSEEVQILLETLPVGVFIARDPDCRTITANCAGFELMRMSGRENLSLSAPEKERPTHFRFYYQGRELSPEQLPVNRAARGENVRNLEVDLLFDDGIERNLLMSSAPLYDGQGRVRGAVAAALDITERRQMLQSLRFLAEASTSLSSLGDFRLTLRRLAHLSVPSFADACCVDLLEDSGNLQRLTAVHADPVKRKLLKTDARYAGLFCAELPDLTECLDTAVPILLPDLDQGTPGKQLSADSLKALRQLGVRSLIGVPLTAKGAPIGVLTFLRGESGRTFSPADLDLAQDLARRASVAIDNVRLYQEVRDADRRKDEFLAMLAHELRNPLAPIRSGLDLLALDDQCDRETIGLMQEQVQHLVRLVDDLLDVSRIMRGKIELRKDFVELSQLIHRSLETVRATCDARRHELLLIPPEHTIWLHADAVRLVQVFENLLSNAVKYTDPGGRVEIRSEIDGPQVVVTIRDTGVGIDADLLPHVFDLFTQSPRSLDRSQGGMGIGLTLVRRLVELHGGAATAYSDGPGQGSLFQIRLPIAESPLPGQDPPLLKRPTRTLRILVVDDNLAAAKLLNMLLSRLTPCILTTAHDGRAALEAVRQEHPDLVLLDIGLPGMDGYSVAQAIRADRNFDDVVLVALTGYGQEEDRQRAREAGFNRHLVKPVETVQLQEVLADF